MEIFFRVCGNARSGLQSTRSPFNFQTLYSSYLNKHDSFFNPFGPYKFMKLSVLSKLTATNLYLILKYLNNKNLDWFSEAIVKKYLI
jgi:hypothetical protein